MVRRQERLGLSDTEGTPETRISQSVCSCTGPRGGSLLSVFQHEDENAGWLPLRELTVPFIVMASTMAKMIALMSWLKYHHCKFIPSIPLQIIVIESHSSAQLLPILSSPFQVTRVPLTVYTFKMYMETGNPFCSY